MGVVGRQVQRLGGGRDGRCGQRGRAAGAVDGGQLGEPQTSSGVADGDNVEETDSEAAKAESEESDSKESEDEEESDDSVIEAPQHPKTKSKAQRLQEQTFLEFIGRQTWQPSPIMSLMTQVTAMVKWLDR